MKKVIKTAQEKFKNIAMQDNVHFVFTIYDNIEVHGHSCNNTVLYFHEEGGNCYYREYAVGIENLDNDSALVARFVHWILLDIELDPFCEWLEGSYYDEHYFRLFCQFVYESDIFEFEQKDIEDEVLDTPDLYVVQDQMEHLANIIGGMTLNEAYKTLKSEDFCVENSYEEDGDEVRARMYVYTSNCRFIVVEDLDGQVGIENDILVDDELVREDSPSVREVKGLDGIITRDNDHAFFLNLLVNDEELKKKFVHNKVYKSYEDLCGHAADWAFDNHEAEDLTFEDSMRVFIEGEYDEVKRENKDYVEDNVFSEIVSGRDAAIAVIDTQLSSLKSYVISQIKKLYASGYRWLHDSDDNGGWDWDIIYWDSELMGLYDYTVCHSMCLHGDSNRLVFYDVDSDQEEELKTLSLEMLLVIYKNMVR